MNRFWVFAASEVTPDFISNSIMKALGTTYSHVGVIVTYNGAFDSKAEIYHATGEGVNCANLEEYLKTHALEHLIDVTDKLTTKHEGVCAISQALGWCRAHLGLEYSDSQYVGFILPWLKRFVNNDKTKFICSEFVAEFLNACSTIEAFRNADCDFLDPKQVMQAILHEGEG